MKTLSLRVPDALDKILRRKAKRRRTSKSVLVKGVLENYYGPANSKTNGKKRAMGQVIGDLAGCLEGPGDLSYNRKHMEGFGK